MKLIDNKRKIVIVTVALVVIAIIGSIIIKNTKQKKVATITNNENSKVMSTVDEQNEIEINDEVEEIFIQDEANEEELIEEINKDTSSEEQNGDKVPTSSATGYYIMINNQANVVTVYQKDGNGEFQPIKAMICSTGSATPRSGVYSVQGKWQWGKLFGNVWGHYVTKIVGNILFHSVPYTAESPSSLEYWEYDKLGTSASMGCVRLSVIDSKWIFDNMPIGTPIEFYSSSNPGPLGKPATQQISWNEECRNWDPTDPDPNNPWRTYTTKTVTTEENNNSSNANAENENKIENTTVNTVENTATNTTQNTTPNNTTQNNTTNTETNENTTTNTVENNTVEENQNTTDATENIIGNTTEVQLVNNTIDDDE